MRPNIQISHALNGRVKDYAADHDLSTPEAYERIIRAGLADLDGDGQPDSETGGQPATADEHADPAPTPDARAQLRPHVAGSGPLLERRLDALEAMVEYLQAHGEATKGDLLPLADPDAVDYKDADSVWSNLVKGTLSEVDGVQSPPSGKETWRWTGEEK
jgi:hypothetical protein